MYYNAYSILSKIDELRAECLVAKADIILLAETFCRDDITDAYLNIPGYQIICRRDGRDTAGGRGRGLLVYVRVGIPASRLQLEGEDMVTECCGIAIPCGRGEGEEMKIVLVYRPPGTPGGLGEGGNTERLCNLLRGLRGRTLVVGDFNLPHTDWDRGWSRCGGEMLVVDTVGDMFWSQLVRGPTHRLGNTLDLVMTSSLE